MGASETVKLEVFVKQGCDSCNRARHLAEHVDAEFPELTVEIVDIGASAAKRDDVFAVPTFILQDRVLSLGNPPEEELHQEVLRLLRVRGLV